MSLHLTRVQVENFKRLKEVDIDIDGKGVVEIAGRNAQGKSSLIDAIWNTLGGKQRDVSRPVRDGESKATATVTVEDSSGGGLEVTRTWKANGQSTLRVKPLGGGTSVDKPQNVLDDLIGAFAFDPLAFTTLTPVKQREALVDLIGLDLSALDEEYETAYRDRTEANREVKRLQGSLDSLERPAKDLPEEFVSVNDLIKEREDVARVSRKVEEMHRRIEDLRIEMGELEKKIFSGEEWLDSRRSLADITLDIDNAEATNQAIHAASTFRERKDELKAAEKLANDLDKRVADAKQAKVDALEAAQLPLEGLSFDESGVTYNGVPFSQASAAERRKVSMAMAMAMNPELRVICLKDASLIDEEGHRQIRQMAEENDYQLVLELVGNPGGDVIVIEDGEVSA